MFFFLTPSVVLSKARFKLSATDKKDLAKFVMANLEASAPPLRDHVTVSFAVKVCTAVVFSLIDFELFESPALPDGPVIDGEVSSTLLTETVSV